MQCLFTAIMFLNIKSSSKTKVSLACTNKMIALSLTHNKTLFHRLARLVKNIRYGNTRGIIAGR